MATSHLCRLGTSLTTYGQITNRCLAKTEAPLLSSSWTTVIQVRTKYRGWKMLRDQQRRECVQEYYPFRQRLNAIRKNTILPKELQEVADKEIAELPRNSALNRLVQRCSITSRPRGIVAPWRLSRIMFRHFADYNKLSGVKRHSK